MRNKKGFSLTEAIVVVAIIVMVTVTAFATINKNPDNNEFEGKSALQKMSDIVDNYYMTYGTMPTSSDIIAKDKISEYGLTGSNSSKYINYSISGNIIVGAVYTKIGCYYLRKDFDPTGSNAALLWIFKAKGSNCSSNDVNTYTSEVAGRGATSTKPILI